MRLPDFKRLFWKIFLALWLSSFSVILITAIVVTEIAERATERDELKWRALVQAERMIELLEKGKSRKSPRLFKDRHDWHRKQLPISLYDTQGKLLVGKPQFDQNLSLIEFEVQGYSGKTYRAVMPEHPARTYAAKIPRLVFSFQFVLVLIASAAGSALLSFIVVRPVNRLREHVSSLRSGEHDLRLDPKLLSRGDELGELAQEFDRMAQYVDSTLKNQQRLLQDVSHELRAPLARIQAATGLVEQQLGEGDRLTQRLNLECERLDRLVGELLTLSRLDSIDSKSATFDLIGVIEQSVDDFQFADADRSVNTLWNQDVNYLCQGNPELLIRALSNIFGNILKHTPAGSSVDLSVFESETNIHIVFQDHGNGVAVEDIESLFIPFFRRSTEQSASGYGLGLSIAKNAVERLGGEIRAESAPDSGLTVVIELPLQ